MLTLREKQILEATINYIEDNGYAPTVREIGGIVGLKSPATVHGYLNSLEKKGCIERKENSPRALKILKNQKK